jgi:hypothetical protein
MAPALGGGFGAASAVESSEKCTTDKVQSGTRIIAFCVEPSPSIVRFASAPSRRSASLRPRCARLAALTAHPRTSRGNYRRPERNHLTTRIGGTIVELSSTAACSAAPPHCPMRSGRIDGPRSRFVLSSYSSPLGCPFA